MIRASIPHFAHVITYHDVALIVYMEYTTLIIQMVRSLLRFVLESHMLFSFFTTPSENNIFL